jgi:hypothetical protein
MVCATASPRSAFGPPATRGVINKISAWGSKWFARLSNGFRKRIECHLAAVSLHVAFYNICRVHESLRSTPAMALGIADHVWSISELIEAALSAVRPLPTPTVPDRRRQFRVIEGGKS